MFSLKILITEDDTISALLLKKALEKNHHRIIGMADSGEMALEILEKNHADIVMMDINLSGKLDGIKTTEIINESIIFQWFTLPPAQIAKPCRRWPLPIQVLM